MKQSDLHKAEETLQGRIRTVIAAIYSKSTKCFSKSFIYIESS